MDEGGKEINEGKISSGKGKERKRKEEKERNAKGEGKESSYGHNRPVELELVAAQLGH